MKFGTVTHFALRASYSCPIWNAKSNDSNFFVHSWRPDFLLTIDIWIMYLPNLEQNQRMSVTFKFNRSCCYCATMLGWIKAKLQSLPFPCVLILSSVNTLAGFHFYFSTQYYWFFVQEKIRMICTVLVVLLWQYNPPWSLAYIILPWGSITKPTLCLLRLM